MSLFFWAHWRRRSSSENCVISRKWHAIVYYLPAFRKSITCTIRRGAPADSPPQCRYLRKINFEPRTVRGVKTKWDVRWGFFRAYSFEINWFYDVIKGKNKRVLLGAEHFWKWETKRLRDNTCVWWWTCREINYYDFGNIDFWMLLKQWRLCFEVFYNLATVFFIPNFYNQGVLTWLRHKHICQETTHVLFSIAYHALWTVSDRKIDICIGCDVMTKIRWSRYITKD